MKARTRLAEGGFNVRKFMQNSKQLMSLVHGSNDTLVMDLAAVLEKSPMETVTKRDVLAATAKMYDPLGLLCPVIVRLKIFFQELCRCKRDWDDPLQEQHLTE